MMSNAESCIDEGVTRLISGAILFHPFQANELASAGYVSAREGFAVGSRWQQRFLVGGIPCTQKNLNNV